MNKVFLFIFNLALVLNPQLIFAQTEAATEDVSQPGNEEVITACMSTAIVTANADQTVEQLLKICEGKTSGIVQERLFFEKSVGSNPFAILPHRPNYLLPVSYSELNQTLYQCKAVE